VIIQLQKRVIIQGDIKTRKSSFCKRSSSAFYFSLPDDVRKMSAKHPANLAVPSQLGNLPTWQLANLATCQLGTANCQANHWFSYLLSSTVGWVPKES